MSRIDAARFLSTIIFGLGDLPWYKVKKSLKQIQNKSQVLQAVTSLGLTFRVANKHGSPAISVVYWLVKTGFFLTSLKKCMSKTGWRSCRKITTTNGSDWVLQDPSNEQSNFMGLSLFHMTYRGSFPNTRKFNKNVAPRRRMFPL